MSFRGLVKAFIPRKLFKRIEPTGHLIEAALLNLLYGFPGRKLKVIGVTGTNGKTSTCFLIHRMMREAGYSVGLMTTVAYGAGHKINPQVHHMTNVAVPELMERLRWFNKQGVEWLVLETTSHALAQNRVWGIPYSLGVMTNVTHEHLDYHGSFEKYRDTKIKLFKLVNKNRKGLRTGVINADDESAKLFAKAVHLPFTYGLKQGEIVAKDIKATANSSRFKAHSLIHPDRVLDVKVNLPGEFNVYNALAAVGVGLALEMEPHQIEEGIAALKDVEGRMTSIDEGQPFSVIVDFAHTPDSFEKLFRDLRPVVKDKMIVMFGSAGRRDEAKRAIMGGLAGKYADEVVLTEEDDRDVDGIEILNQIAGGAEKAGKKRDENLFLVHKREEAIAFALGRAKSADDMVLLLGKGHEKTIERAHGEDPYDEIAIAKKTLQNRSQ